ncbi:MAG: hypothetical protein HOP08_02515 [Cyclobacteriaceae bacterium]|nr:hypothetical protein [Cyclobacteriaceae bacterium]
MISLSPFKSMTAGLIALVVIILVSAFLWSCRQKLDQSEDLDYKGAKYRFESFSKKTIETTIRSRQILYTPVNSDDKKVLVGFASEELNTFPVDPDILKNTEYVIIDTVLHDRYKLLPTQAPHTLYLDPNLFSKEDYNAIVDFVRDLYAKPIESNKLVRWMDDTVLGVEPGDVYFTIHAIVYEKLSAFEPVFTSPNGKDWLRVKVNQQLHLFKILEGGMQSESESDYYLKNDTLYYPDYEQRAAVDELLGYKSSDGTLFSSKAKVVVPTKVN